MCPKPASIPNENEGFLLKLNDTCANDTSCKEGQKCCSDECMRLVCANAIESGNGKYFDFGLFEPELFC